jgi:hypothetical protein
VSAGSKPDRAGLSKVNDPAEDIKVIHFGDQLMGLISKYARDVFAQ